MSNIIVRKQEPTDKEKTLKLEEVAPGDMIRFAEIPFDVAVKDSQFFIVCTPIETADKEKRVRICSFGGVISHRDPDRPVVRHTTTIEFVPSI